MNSLSRITPHLDLKKKKILIYIFFIFQFNFCQLIWMCHNCSKNNKINRFHERCLRLLYYEKKSSFHDLLEKDGSVSIHYKKLRALATEMYRIYNGMALEIVREILPLRPQGQNNLRNWSDFTLPYQSTMGQKVQDTCVQKFGKVFQKI